MENSEIQLIERKKRYLKRYKRNKACIERLEAKRDRLDEKITSVRSPNLSGMPRGGTPITVEDLIADKMETEKRIERLKVRGKKLREDILDWIYTLDDSRYIELLESHFIYGHSIDETAENIGYSKRYTYLLYTKAIEELPWIDHQSES